MNAGRLRTWPRGHDPAGRRNAGRGREGEQGREGFRARLSFRRRFRSPPGFSIRVSQSRPSLAPQTHPLARSRTQRASDDRRARDRTRSVKQPPASPLALSPRRRPPFALQPPRRRALASTSRLRTGTAIAIRAPPLPCVYTALSRLFNNLILCGDAAG